MKFLNIKSKSFILFISLYIFILSNLATAQQSNPLPMRLKCGKSYNLNPNNCINSRTIHVQHGKHKREPDGFFDNVKDKNEEYSIN